MAGLGLPELMVILAIVLLLFGSAKLPQLARSLGKAKSEFQRGTGDTEEEEPAARSVRETERRSPTVE